MSTITEIKKQPAYRHLLKMFKYSVTADADKASDDLFKLMGQADVSFDDFTENNGFDPISDGSAVISEDEDDIADMEQYPGGTEKNQADIDQDQAQEDQIRNANTRYIVYDAEDGSVSPVTMSDVKYYFQQFIDYVNHAA